MSATTAMNTITTTNNTASEAKTSLVAGTGAGASTTDALKDAPLLAPWTGPYGGVPPFDKIKVSDFPAALEAAIEEERRDIDAIANNPESPNFANTLVALEKAGETLMRVRAIFDLYRANLATPDVQALDQEWQPKLAAVDDERYFNEKLFARIHEIYQNHTVVTEGKRDVVAGGDKPVHELDPTDARLLDIVHRKFVRSGAQLDAAGKKRLGEINQRLAALYTEFDARVLKDEETWIVLGQDDLAGLSDSLISAYKAAAQERNLPDGQYAVVNTRSSVDPFLTFSARRDLREKVWKQFKNRGDNGNEADTNALIVEITKLRAERAKLLGFANHAEFNIQDNMAKTPELADALMEKVWKATVARVREEVADMQAIAEKEGFEGQIEPWDYLYYAEKVRKARYDMDQDELKPYFELNNMIEAAFWTAEQLYGMTFKEITGKVPVFHPDVRVWEVLDKRTNRHIGLFYGDYFARSGKRSGAWMTGYRYYQNYGGVVITPLVSNNNNFVKGAPGEPVLISLDDATTLFHEFGHAIHYLSSNARYLGLSETPCDFVEFPSQVLENWVLTRPILDRFARHYKTGEAMPQELVEKVRAANKFNQGYATAEYLSAAIVDMQLHKLPDGVDDPKKFEADVLAKIGAPREVAMRHRLAHFLHLFSSDHYSAAYYAYLWADVMASDAWDAFEETGDVFNPDVANKMYTYILSPLNGSDRAAAFRSFRGRDPSVNALLKRRGFPVEASE